jgi:AraC family transcriptional regulator
MLEFAEAGMAYDVFAFTGAPMRVIGMELPAATVGRWLGDDAPPLNLAGRQEHFDDEVADLLVMLWRDASEGGMHGRLYTEGLTTALLGLLSTRYRANSGSTAKRAACLGREEQSRLLAFIASELGGDLSVERMADVVRMSPFHFSRVFRVTFQQSPHAFLLTQRLDAACAAMRREPTRSLADIAIDCGFASQAHFAETFRRKMGATPGRWRRSEC